jgi:DNA-binding LacI/PurR family transcriptional regulator
VERTRRPTSADVAARAGVSRATVSYVLSGSTRHSFPAATRERVLRAAADLGYTPHAAARALRRGTSGVVLLVLADVPIGANLGTLIAETTAAVAATGRSLVTWTAGVGPALRETLAHVDPVVLLTLVPLSDDDRVAVEAIGVPVVAVANGLAAGADDGGFSRGEVHVGLLQLSCLAAAGHRRVAVVSVRDRRLQVFARGRAEGVRRAALELGLDAPVEVSLGDPDDAATAEVAALLTGWVRAGVTGVACYNDQYAGVVVAAARRAGLAVPADLSVVGVDDEPMGAFLDPPLTTVRYDVRGAAEHVVGQVAAVVDGGEPPGPRSSLSVSLVTRGSVGPAPSR